jgi:plastocyanin
MVRCGVIVLACALALSAHAADLQVPGLQVAGAHPLGPHTSNRHASNPWAHPKPMTVTMVDNRFQPDHLTFQAGQAYTLHLVNRGKEMHEFTAPEFFKAAHVRDMSGLANGGTDVVVQPGQSAAIVLVAPPAGHYPLSCADHDWDGMLGQIDVR